MTKRERCTEPVSQRKECEKDILREKSVRKIYSEPERKMRERAREKDTD